LIIITYPNPVKIWHRINYFSKNALTFLPCDYTCKEKERTGNVKQEFQKYET
jgi:hypothetical protein